MNVLRQAVEEDKVVGNLELEEAREGPVKKFRKFMRWELEANQVIPLLT